ncbi:hypothetical protein HK104_011046 [Borealophlyctis nickersoniae]|nr:hypothetical protein HK104_011046 [Borealophlyctis nickersoniae]
MDDAASVILACRRLLAQQTWTETEARAARAACDGWLDKYRYTQPQLVSRKPCRVPTELVVSILRQFRRDEDRKTTLLTCRLVNKEWRQLAWARFWYKVEDKAAQGAASRLLHRWAVDALKGIQVRRLQITSDTVDFSACRGLGALLGLPWLVALDASRVQVDSVEGIFSECEGGKVWRRLWKDKDRAIWKAGFGNLKSLPIAVQWDLDKYGFDFVDTMAASLGAELESLSVRMAHEPAALNSFLHKLAGCCPNLRDLEVTPPFEELHQFPHFLESVPHLVHLNLTSGATDSIILAITKCIHLKYLTIWDNKPITHGSIRHLANGPFLRFFQYRAGVQGSFPKEEHYESFLKERGRCLEVLKAVIGNATDRTLGGVVAFLKASQKLERIALPEHLKQNEAVVKAANGRNVGWADLFNDFYAHAMEEHWMGW